jgi:hypothetical protein
LLIAGVLLSLFAGCVDPQPVGPTLVFPTPVPTDVPSSDTPHITGACTLLTATDIRESLGIDAVQASSSPLSCGYSHGASTIALTLVGSSVWSTFVESFSSTDTPQALGVGEEALFFPQTLDGLAMAREGQEVYLLSGVPNGEAAREMMSRIISRNRGGGP